MYQLRDWKEVPLLTGRPPLLLLCHGLAGVGLKKKISRFETILICCTRRHVRTHAISAESCRPGTFSFLLTAFTVDECLLFICVQYSLNHQLDPLDQLDHAYQHHDGSSAR